MSRRHENVSCDSCLRSNFQGKRFKCLVCSDYDLCEVCRGTSDGRHSADHPMQVLLTPADFALYFGPVPGDESGPALSCPLCGSLGLSESALQSHLLAYHPTELGSREVMCPACALLPIRESSMLTEDLANHLLTEHSHREAVSLSGDTEPLRRRPLAPDPIGELLSSLSRRGLQRGGYRPPSAYSLVRPLSASSSSGGLSVQQPVHYHHQRRSAASLPAPLQLGAASPATSGPMGPPTGNGRDGRAPTLLGSNSQGVPQPSESQLEEQDSLRLQRSEFTRQLLLSALSASSLNVIDKDTIKK